MAESEVAQTEHALRATSDSLLTSVEELYRLENEKRTLTPDDPRLVQVSSEIERIAARVLGATVEQRVLSEQAAVEVAVEGPAAPVHAIEEVTPRMPHEILAAWRDAERRAEAAEPASPEAAAVATEIERLRLEYREARTRLTAEP
jgi:hypothetical protein